MFLTAEQITQFDRDGFLVLPGLLTPDDAAGLRRETEHYHEALIGSAPPEVDVTWEPNTNPPRIQQILNAERLSALLARIISSDRLQSAVVPILGPDVGLFHVKFIMKSPSVGGPVPWHQDFAYWTADADAPLQLNCMVYLDDADERNGCLQVIAGSHRVGFERHADHSSTTKGSFVHEIDMPEASAVVSLPGPAGTGILFGPLLKHASPPNRSTQPRRTFTVVYSAAGTGHPLRQVYWSRPHDVSQLSQTLKATPAFVGEGPHAGQCSAAYHRRELWKLATAHARDVGGTWVEVVMSPTVGESLEWFAGRRPVGEPVVRFDTYLPGDVSSPGVTVVRPSGLTGPTEADVNTHVCSLLSLLHVEGGVFAPLAQALAALAPRIAAGTVLVVDRFFDADGHVHESADALQQATRAHDWRVEVLARAGTAVAAVVASTNGESAIVLRDGVLWVPTVSGIELARGTRAIAADAPGDATPVADAETGLRRARRAAGMVKRALGLVGEWEAFFPVTRIPTIVGNGPRRNLCATHARRRELWRYAVSLVEVPAQTWCEFGVGEGESLDWFLLHKPAQTPVIGFDTFEGIPEPWLNVPAGQWKAAPYVSSRADLAIMRGTFADSLRNPAIRKRLAAGIGLLHVDCDLYESTKVVLGGVREFLRPGTVIIFDEFHGFGGYQQYEAGAFKEFVEAERVSFEYVVLSDFQVAVRLLALGDRAAVHVRPLTYTSSTPGILVQPGASARDDVKAALAVLRSGS